eukprot:COSAG01_NODE_4370_length_5090_cov_80.890002_5_plen_101_part_00
MPKMRQQYRIDTVPVLFVTGIVAQLLRNSVCLFHFVKIRLGKFTDTALLVFFKVDRCSTVASDPIRAVYVALQTEVVHSCSTEAGAVIFELSLRLGCHVL